MKKYQCFLSENFQFLDVKFSIYLNRHVFVMCCTQCDLKMSALFCLFQAKDGSCRKRILFQTVKDSTERLRGAIHVRQPFQSLT